MDPGDKQQGVVHFECIGLLLFYIFWRYSYHILSRSRLCELELLKGVKEKEGVVGIVHPGATRLEVVRALQRQGIAFRTLASGIQPAHAGDELCHICALGLDCQYLTGRLAQQSKIQDGDWQGANVFIFGQAETKEGEARP